MQGAGNMTVESLNKSPVFPQDAELANIILDLIEEYAGEISICSAMGALDCVKMTLWTDSFLEFSE